MNKGKERALRSAANSAEIKRLKMNRFSKWLISTVLVQIQVVQENYKPKKNKPANSNRWKQYINSLDIRFSYLQT